MDPHSIFNINWFTLLSLPCDFAINDTALEQGYLRMQKLAHPDKWSGAQKEVATHLSAHINMVYTHLKHPKLRAEYMLKYYNAWPVPSNNSVLEHVFLLKSQSEKERHAAYNDALKMFTQAMQDNDISRAHKAYLYLCYLTPEELLC